MNIEPEDPSLSHLQLLSLHGPLGQQERKKINTSIFKGQEFGMHASPLAAFAGAPLSPIGPSGGDVLNLLRSTLCHHLVAPEGNCLPRERET